MSARFILRLNAIDELRRFVVELNLKRILLVTNRNSFTASGIDRLVLPTLGACEHHRFCDFSVNPSAEDVIRGTRALASYPADGVIAVGGGSALDMGKLVLCLSADAPQGSEDLRRRITASTPYQRSIPLIAIPTTAGSGSEATHFATVYVGSQKYSVSDRSLYPDIALVDPRLCYSLPKHVTAYTGFDAIAQAIEAYWSRRATNESRQHALTALALLWPAIRTAVNNPTPAAREAMSFGAFWAGRAIDIAKTTAPHALSYYLTAEYHVPHGHAVALFLPHFFVVNEAACDHGEIYRIMGVRNAAEARHATLDLMRDVGLSTNLPRSDAHEIDKIVQSVDPNRLSNNPVTLGPRELSRVLLSASALVAPRPSDTSPGTGLFTQDA